MRKDFIVAINYSKYLAFVLATVCVLLFQFLAIAFCITLALSLYVVAFGLMTASQVLHAKELFEANTVIKQKKLTEVKPIVNEEGTLVVNGASELKGEEVEPVNIKNEMVWSVAGSIFFGLFTVFTFIVLVLY